MFYKFKQHYDKMCNPNPKIFSFVEKVLNRFFATNQPLDTHTVCIPNDLKNLYNADVEKHFTDMHFKITKRIKKIQENDGRSFWHIDHLYLTFSGWV